jgi:hypothetical protein
MALFIVLPAVDVISEGMRIELTEFGIRVTNIQPGAVETDFSKVRFKGDDERAATVYAGYEPLLPEDIADTIAYCINVPERVSIAEIAIYPKAQAEPKRFIEINCLIIRILLLFFCFTFVFGISQNKKEKTLLSQVSKLDSMMQNNDSKVLDLFSDDVSFGHSNGWIQNKEISKKISNPEK